MVSGNGGGNAGGDNWGSNEVMVIFQSDLKAVILPVNFQ